MKPLQNGQVRAGAAGGGRARWAAAAALHLAGAAWGQPADPASPASPANPGNPAAAAAPGAAPAEAPVLSLRDAFAEADTLPPAARLGVRAHVLREAQSIWPTLVVVPDEASALAAMNGWRGLYRFPVLIDDGTAEAAELIGQFTRAFKPEGVMRWNPGLGMPAEEDQQRALVLQSLARVFGLNPPLDDLAAIVEKPSSSGLRPMGVVALDVSDPAWIGGFALAAGRVQPIVFIESQNNAAGQTSAERAGELARAIQAGLIESGLTWNSLGDDVDAVTIAANVPTRVVDEVVGAPGGQGSQGVPTLLSLTDRVVRDGAASAARWAWAGQVIGDGKRSLYAAMCSLMLPTGPVLVFDGYPDEPPFNAFDGTDAAARLREAGYRVSLFDVPNAGVVDWRALSRLGVSAGLVLVNSKGTANRFHLEPGVALSGDVPPLRRPAIVSMVHSFSASEPTGVGTIAGRFLSQGAYAYFGSVDEPYLQAFLPTPLAARRLVGGATVASALWADNAPAWKLTLLGDPLLTLTSADRVGLRVEESPNMKGAETSESVMRAALKDKSYAAGVRELVILGRDADAVRLVKALAKDQPDAVGNAVSAAALLAAYREGEADLVALLFGQLAPIEAGNAVYQDALWQAFRTATTRGRAPAFEPLLARALREGQQVDDAIELADAVRKHGSGPEAAAVIRRVLSLAKNDQERRRLEQKLAEFGG